MPDVSFFKNPVHAWQRRYEALRASLVERQPDRIVAERFGYNTGYIRLLRHNFRHGKIDFCEPPPEGASGRRVVTAEVRGLIRSWRTEGRLSAGAIAELLSERGHEVSVRTVERVLAEEGFPRLPRRTSLKLGLTAQGAQVPERSEAAGAAHFDGQVFESAGAGVFLFAPFLAQLDIQGVVAKAKLPGSTVIPALQYFLSFLALKLLGNERYAHVGEHAFDQGLGLFAGVNVLPKCTAMSTYSYSLDEAHILQLQRAFVQSASNLGLYSGNNIVNLDFHTVPHFGDESVLEKHWAGARGRTMKGALTLIAQDAESKLMLYTAADIQRAEASDQALEFLSFWQSVHRGSKPTLVFDSGFTTYPKLSKLNAEGVKFLTLRRRGSCLVKNIESIKSWTRIHIPHAKRKYPNPLVHESTIHLRGYNGPLRQIIMKGNGREKPTFLITNDFETPVEVLVGTYARRWRVENGIAEAVKFFHLNALSSPILVKVHFDVVMTAIADTLYTMLARKLRGFEACDAPKLYRSFVQGRAKVTVAKGKATVTFPRRAHNPILRGIPWTKLPQVLPGFPDIRLELKFE